MNERQIVEVIDENSRIQINVKHSRFLEIISPKSLNIPVISSNSFILQISQKGQLGWTTNKKLN